MYLGGMFNVYGKKIECTWEHDYVYMREQLRVNGREVECL